MTLAAAVATAGVVLCGLAWYAIGSDPEKLGGRNLAAAGVILPVALVVVGFGLTFMWTLVGRISNGPVMGLTEKQALAGMNAQNLEDVVDSMLFNIPWENWTADRERLSHLIDPNRRGWLLALDEGTFVRLREHEELGLVLVDPATLAAPLYEYDITDCILKDHAARVTITRGTESLTFPMVQASGYWYFGVGKVKRKGADP
jgi:hypothetical protein